MALETADLPDDLEQQGKALNSSGIRNRHARGCQSRCGWPPRSWRTLWRGFHEMGFAAGLHGAEEAARRTTPAQSETQNGCAAELSGVREKAVSKCTVEVDSARRQAAAGAEGCGYYRVSQTSSAPL